MEKCRFLHVGFYCTVKWTFCAQQIFSAKNYLQSSHDKNY